MAQLPGNPGTGELAMLRAICSRAANISNVRVTLGIGDDCALLRPGRSEELAVTTDLSIAERHFRLDWHPPESVGHRTLARGLSDLAAMGAQPVAAFLSLALQPKLARAPGRRTGNGWLDRFLDGFLALAAQHGVALAGGDLAESPLTLADIVLTGVVPRGEALLRSGAEVGDRVCVTGTLGGAAAELAKLAAHPRRFSRLRSAADLAHHPHPHLYPQPRIAQGLALRRRGLATAALDISDGLSTELAHLAVASGVHIEIDASRIPLGHGATLDQALHGGEDYELLFTSPARARLPRAIAGVPITVIGSVANLRRGVAAVTLLHNGARQPLSPRGWEHFR